MPKHVANGPSLGGRPLTVLSFFADTPRALAVTPDGTKVYMAAFFSGNGTATSFMGNFFGARQSAAASSTLPSSLRRSTSTRSVEPQPLTGVIVKYDGTHWKDETGLIRDA